MPMGSSCLNLAPMVRETASSTHRQAWPSMPMEILLLLIGETVESRLTLRQKHFFTKSIVDVKLYKSYSRVLFFYDVGV